MNEWTWQEVFPVRSRRGAVACGLIGWAVGLAMDAVSAYAFHVVEYREGLGWAVVIKTLLLVVTLLWATRRGERADRAVTSGRWFNVVWLWWIQVLPSLMPFLSHPIGWVLTGMR